MNDDELQAMIQKGHSAADLLNSDAFNDMVKELKDSYFNQWVSSKTPEEREKLHSAVLAMEDIVNGLIGQVSQGHQAEMALAGDNANQDGDGEDFSSDQPFWPDNMMESH
jgi:hypothetical protein